MTPDIEEHHLRSESNQSPVTKVKHFISVHQTGSIVALFLLLPLIVISTVAAFISLSSRSAENNAALTPTPTPIAQVQVTTAVGEPTSTPDETVTPTKKATSTPKPTTSITATKTPTPGPTNTPTQSLANLYFHSVVCNYTETASGSATIKELTNDKTFASSSEVPDQATCDVIFQNSENVETGEIKYLILMDNSQVKSENVGKLKKGNYPDSEYKKYHELVTLTKTSGSHELKFEINPDVGGTRAFSETSYSDNVRTIKYKVN